MRFRSFSLPFAGVAMALLPTAMGFSLSRTTLGRPPKTIRRLEMATEDASFGPPAEKWLPAYWFFFLANIDFDPESFQIDERPDSDALGPSNVVYRADAFLPGREGRNTVRIYWTLAQDAKRVVDGRSYVYPTEGIITRCWINKSESDHTIRKLLYTPDELGAAVGTLENEENTSRRIYGDDKISPDVIDESSLAQDFIHVRDGHLIPFFTAESRLATLETNEATSMRKQIIWWRTVGMERDVFRGVENPFGKCSHIFTDYRFLKYLSSMRDSVEETGFLREFAVRLKGFAISSRIRVGKIPMAFLGEENKLPPQPHVVPGLLSVAGIFLFLAVGPFRVSWRKIRQDILMTGLVKNYPYHRAMIVWFFTIILLEVRMRIGPLERKSPLVQHLTTLGIVIQSVCILLQAAGYCIVSFLKAPILASLKLLSATTRWWRRKRGIAKKTIFDDMMGRLLSLDTKVYGNVPMWMSAIFFAPVLEELTFRFAFDKVWHGFRGRTDSVLALNSSPWIQPAWIWANSLLFGLIHLSNFFPLPLVPHSDPDSSGLSSRNPYAQIQDVGVRVIGALFQSIGAFLSAFLVLNPIYVRHGISSSICAHAIINSVPIIVDSVADVFLFVGDVLFSDWDEQEETE